LLFINPIVSISGGSSNEKGSTITSVSLSWSYNKSIVNQSLNGLSIDASIRDEVLTGLSITTNTPFTIIGNDGTNSCSSTTNVNFYDKRYWGTSANTSLNDAEIIALSSEFSTSRGQSRNFNCSGGKYFYFAYPAFWGSASFTVGGLAFSDMNLTTRSFVNASGYSESYNIYRCNNIQTGSSINVVVS